MVVFLFNLEVDFCVETLERALVKGGLGKKPHCGIGLPDVYGFLNRLDLRILLQIFSSSYEEEQVYD